MAIKDDDVPLWQDPIFCDKAVQEVLLLRHPDRSQAAKACPSYALDAWGYVKAYLHSGHDEGFKGSVWERKILDWLAKDTVWFAKLIAAAFQARENRERVLEKPETAGECLDAWYHWTRYEAGAVSKLEDLIPQTAKEAYDEDAVEAAINQRFDKTFNGSIPKAYRRLKEKRETIVNRWAEPRKHMFCQED